MATAAVAPSFASYQGATGGFANYSGQSTGPSFPYAVDRCSMSTESVAPFPPNPGPVAGADAVIGAENDGLLSVAAVGALVAGVAALGIPIAYELSGARVKNRYDKYIAANEVKNDAARSHIGSGFSRIFDTLEHDYQKGVESSVLDLKDPEIRHALHKLGTTTPGVVAAQPKLSAKELHTLRRGILLTLMEHAHAQQDHESYRALEREHHILEKVGPGDPGTHQIHDRVLDPTTHEATDFHQNRRAFRSPELHMHNRFLGFIDEIASLASVFSRTHRAPRGKALFNPAKAHTESWQVQRPRNTEQVQAFYGSLAQRPHPWVRALHTAGYIDQQWPGLLQDAARVHTTSKDRFEVWIEHPTPKNRVVTDQPVPEAATRIVAVFAHKPANDAALRNVDYSLGRELDVAYGNYGAFKSSPFAAKLRQVAHRYSLYLWGAKDTMANPRGMGLVLANLGVTSITLSALLYGMLYLVEYGKIESDLKQQLPSHQANSQAATAA